MDQKYDFDGWSSRWDEDRIGFHVARPNPFLLQYWHHLDELTHLLLSLLEDGLGLARGCMTEPMAMPLTNMTLLHYPTRPDGLQPSGIHPHKDTDILTIIAPLFATPARAGAF